MGVGGDWLGQTQTPAISLNPVSLAPMVPPRTRPLCALPRLFPTYKMWVVGTETDCYFQLKLTIVSIFNNMLLQIRDGTMFWIIPGNRTKFLRRFDRPGCISGDTYLIFQLHF